MPEANPKPELLETLKIPQPSLKEGTGRVTEASQVPDKLGTIISDGQIKFGFSLSIMVRLKLHVLSFALKSVVVNVIVDSPRSNIPFRFVPVPVDTVAPVASQVVFNIPQLSDCRGAIF